ACAVGVRAPSRALPPRTLLPATEAALRRSDPARPRQPQGTPAPTTSLQSSSSPLLQLLNSDESGSHTARAARNTPADATSKANRTSALRERVGTEVGRTPKETPAHGENSEVLPAESIARAVMTPSCPTKGRTASNFPTPCESVASDVSPRNASPSPCWEPSHARFENN